MLDLELCAASDAVAAASACDSLAALLAGAGADTRARARTAALSALRAHLASRPLQEAAFALIDAATGVAASTDDAAVIDAAIAAFRAHPSNCGGKLFTHACALLHRLVMASPENATHARALRAFDVLVEALSPAGGVIMFFVFMTHDGSDELDGSTATNRAVLLALATLAAGRGLDYAEQHVESRERITRIGAHGVHRVWRDAAMPALLHVLLHDGRSDAALALRAVSLLRRLTDTECCLLSAAATAGAWPAVLGAMRAHPAASALHHAGHQLLVRLAVCPLSDEDEGDDTNDWAQTASAGLIAWCAASPARRYADVSISCAVALLSGSQSVAHKAKYRSSRAPVLAALEHAAQHARRDDGLARVVNAGLAVMACERDDDAAGTAAAIAAVAAMLTGASSDDAAVHCAGPYTLAGIVCRGFCSAALPRPALAMAASSLVGVLRLTQLHSNARWYACAAITELCKRGGGAEAARVAGAAAALRAMQRTPAESTMNTEARCLADGAKRAEKMLTCSTTCAACGTPARELCAGCREAVYCDRDCQLAHWAAHKSACRAAKKAAAAAAA